MSAFPAFQDLSRIIAALMIVNAVLVGLVILFAYRAFLYKERLRELEAANSCTLPPPEPTPLSDDKPIPSVPTPRKVLWKPPVGM